MRANRPEAWNFIDEHPDRLLPNSTVQIHPLTGGTRDGQVYLSNGGPFGSNGSSTPLVHA